jgi:hypothetical protein
VQARGAAAVAQAARSTSSSPSPRESRGPPRARHHPEIREVHLELVVAPRGRGRGRLRSRTGACSRGSRSSSREPRHRFPPWHLRRPRHLDRRRGRMFGSRSPRGGRRSPRRHQRSTTTSWPCLIKAGELAFCNTPSAY